MTWTFDDPKPQHPETEYRIVGPFYQHGMRTYDVWSVRTRQKVGPRCISFDEAMNRIELLLSGKKVFWYGYNAFERKPIF